MTAGELCGVLKRANGEMTFSCSHTTDYRSIGVYVEGEHVLGISKTDSLPPRTIKDANGVIICRGWIDVIALLYRKKFIRKTTELVKLLGSAPFDLIDFTDCAVLPRMDYIPDVVVLKEEDVKTEWMAT